MARDPEHQLKDVEYQLEDIKRLLMLLLLKLDTPLGELAKALKVSVPVVSRMMPSRKIKKFAKPPS